MKTTDIKCRVMSIPRPGLGVQLDMDLVKSRSHIPMSGIHYENPDGSTFMY